MVKVKAFWGGLYPTIPYYTTPYHTIIYSAIIGTSPKPKVLNPNTLKLLKNLATGSSGSHVGSAKARCQRPGSSLQTFLEKFEYRF